MSQQHITRLSEKSPIFKNIANILKAVLLAYLRGIIGSRKIEQACRENVTFIAITEWSTPDHSTIAEFISSIQEEIIFLLRNILLICEEMELLEDKIHEMYIDDIKDKKRINEIENKRRELIKKFGMMLRKCNSNTIE